MNEQKFMRLIGAAGLALMVAVLPWGGDLAYGNTGPKGLTWYANSPSGISPPTAANPLGSDTGKALRKFVDSLAGLSADGGATGANNLGQYIPIAKANTLAYPGSDYYEIGIVPYNEQVHSDLPGPKHPVSDPLYGPGAKFRGYVDLNTLPVAPHYLGPVILAKHATRRCGSSSPTFWARAPRAISSSQWTKPSMGPGRGTLVFRRRVHPEPHLYP